VTILSKREAGLVEERKAQLLRVAHAAHARVESRGGLAKIRSAEIGEFLAFDVSPQVFDGIEFRGIPGQPLDCEPIGLTAQILGHLGTTVSGQAVPDQDDPATAKFPVEGVDQDRGFAAGCPGAADRGTLRDSALVLECDPRLLAVGFF
jgi:hypothetical protein